MPGPDPTPVWLYEPGDDAPTRGLLSLEGAVLTFTPAEGDPIRIEASRMRRARRRRGTPILEVTYARARDPGTSVAFFYFVEPPPLPQPGERADRRGLGALLPGQRGLKRAASMLGLRAANRLLRSEIDRWVTGTRKVMEEGR